MTMTKKQKVEIKKKWIWGIKRAYTENVVAELERSLHDAGFTQLKVVEDASFYMKIFNKPGSIVIFNPTYPGEEVSERNTIYRYDAKRVLTKKKYPLSTLSILSKTKDWLFNPELLLELKKIKLPKIRSLEEVMSEILSELNSKRIFSR